jgi:hypothetical protein
LLNHQVVNLYYFLCLYCRRPHLVLPSRFLHAPPAASFVGQRHSASLESRPRIPHPRWPAPQRLAGGGAGHRSLWGTTASAQPAAEGDAARAPSGSGGGGVKVIRSLLPTRRRLRLDPPAKLYFPCKQSVRGALLIFLPPLDCSCSGGLLFPFY